MKKILKYMIVALLPVFSMANAQNTGAYLRDSSGAIVKTDSGMCWRTSSWTPESAVQECDPDYFKAKIVPAKVQEIVINEEVKMEKPKKSVTLVLRGFFDFDKSDLGRENKEKLRNIVEQAMKENIDSINIVGHTDRFGTEQYNQKLSEKRANVVKNELLALGVENNKIKVEAQGESNPIVNCEGKKTTKVIECLAPNRRVTVEVISSEK